jgi:translocation and assembly module TamB
MTQLISENKQPDSEPTAKKSLLAYAVGGLFAVLLLLVVAMGILAHSDRGSRWLLDVIMSRQNLLQYQYQRGNLVDGLSLKNIGIKVKDIEVNIDHAEVRPGWRALMSRELHFSMVKADRVQVINHGPASTQPFKFTPISLPFKLRLDRAQVQQLQIQTASAAVGLAQIDARGVLWSKSKISVKQAALSRGDLRLEQLRGWIDFRDQYPISAKAQLRIPALRALRADKIQLAVGGDLDSLRAGVATATPQVISGYVIGHPVRKNFPLQGQVSWRKFHWPLLSAQQLYSEQGKLLLSGDLRRLDMALESDLSAQGLPQGHYQAKMYTDLKQLQIEQLLGEVMQGQLDVQAVVDWQKGVTWEASGHLQGLDRHDPHLGALAQQFLPANINAEIGSTGALLADTYKISADVDFVDAEAWHLDLSQKQAGANTSHPWLMQINWQDFDREMPYVGWLKSPRGQVNLNLAAKSSDIVITSDVLAQAKSSLPEGHYQGQLSFAQQRLQIQQLTFVNGASQLGLDGVVHLATAKSPLTWQLNVSAKQFNPQSIVAAVPVDALSGGLKAQGRIQGNQHIIRLEQINLDGHLPQIATTPVLHLAGNSTIALLMNSGKQSGLHSYAVLYDGQLASDALSQGPLRLKLSGTPALLKISEFYHQGAAGQINATGLLNLAAGLKWDVDATLQHFKPQFFTAGVQGDLSGRVKSHGQWAPHNKVLTVENLNLFGQLNQKPVLGRGNLALSFNDSNSLLPQQFEANNLLLSYANNLVQASGNAQRLQLNINAPNLNQLYSGLQGTIKGFVSLQSRPQLDVQANLLMQNLRYGNLLSVESMSLQGRLPTADQPTRLLLNLQKLRSGERQIRQAKIDMMGTGRKHVIDIAGDNQLSKFSLKLAGGLNQHNDWYGQIQQGFFDSKRTQLKQNQAAALIYLHDKNQLTISAHCWISQNNALNQICLDQPLLVSKAQGAVSLRVKNIELGDFQAFMPSGLAITGKVNGYSHLSWRNQQPMQLDTQLLTQNGSIALTAEDEDAEDLTQSLSSTVLKYTQVQLSAKTLAQGLALKVTADTPLLGTGYANLLIGHQAQDKSIAGDLVLNKVKLNILKPFISDVRMIDGQLSAAGKLSGSLNAPQFNGEIRLKDGRLAMLSVPVDWRNIQLQSSIQGHRASLLGGFNAGRGVGKITGSADWSAAPHIQLKVEGQQLLVAQPPSISAVISPTLDIDIRPNIRQLSVTGNIEIPRAVISMPESSPNTINVSSDVRVVRQADDQLAILRAARPWNIRSSVAVNLGQQVIFRGFNSAIPLVGQLNIHQRGTEIALRANGAIGVSRQVKIDAYGQSLDLKRAIVRFNGELANPALDMDASKDVDNYTLGVRITGVANRPIIQIYNDAGLSEQEALNALITGRISSGSSSVNNTEGFKSDVNNTLAAAGISMGLGGTRALTNQIGRSFGLTGLALDAQGTGSNTLVSVTGYITPDLYLRYGVGIFTPVNKLTLRYQVNRRLYMEASSSVERAVDIFYNWRF